MSFINHVIAIPVAETQNELRPFDIQPEQCPRFVEFLGGHAAFNFKLELKELCDRSAEKLSIDFYSFAKQDATMTIQTLIQFAVSLNVILEALVLTNALEVAEELKAIPVARVCHEVVEKTVEEKVNREADRIIQQVEKETDRIAKQTEKVIKKGKKKLKKALKKW